MWKRFDKNTKNYYGFNQSYSIKANSNRKKQIIKSLKFDGRKREKNI